ncbi:MAG: DNA polymerase I [Saprospiraceae bacterium]|nr:DNA polymerase I [Saprospiraceae bacterium]
MADKKLFLLDGHALVYRAHFAFITRPLINSKGVNTSAITGFVRTLWDLLVNQNPTHIAVAFDPKGGTFRHEYFPEYKANRDATPEDIVIALPYIRQIVEAFNIPVVEVPNYEADDTIGTLAKQAEKEGFDVYMVTPDKDYAQLVSEKIFMYKPSRQGNGVDILGEKEVLEKWDIENVLQVIDVLGLQGDSVDNIPGVPGIGPKTAVKLLKQFNSLEGILSSTDQLKGKQKENLENFAEQARLSYRLATIDLNVPIQFDAEKYVVESFNKEALEELFKELEFRTLAHQILGQGEESKPKSQQGDLFASYSNATSKEIAETKKSYSVAKKDITTLEHDYKLIDTQEDRAELVKKLEQLDAFSFDTETTNIDANLAELVGLVFSFEEGIAYYVPIPEDQNVAKSICAEFKGVLEDENIEIIGQNIKYDALVMRWYGVILGGKFFDTMIAHYLCEPDLRHKLDYLAESYLDYKMVPITDVIGKAGKNQLNMRDIDVEKVKEYAGEDADMTLRLKAPFTEMLKENEIYDLYNTLEAPLIKVLTAVEFEGVRINKDFLNEYSVTLGNLILDIKKEIYTDAGVEFNIGSPKQVGQVLFERMEIPYRWRKTSSGQYSTDVAKLTELAPNHEIVNKILTYRKYSKLKSTYVDALPLMINPKTNRVHSNFNQARAATGRLSSDNPNLQNIPIRDEAGREIRKAFEPRDKDHILLAADYSQIELRLIAEISKDEAMMEAFLQGNDFHRATAAKVYDVPYDEVTADQRRNAKTVNFSITYGAGATNLSRQLNIKRTEATELIAEYFKQFQGLKRYMDETIEFARENGYVKTLLGRRRNLRDINSKNGLSRSNAERMAINTPIQGTAADMIKIAMINIQKKLEEENYSSKMILQVHDELVFDVYKPELEKLKAMVEEEMKNAIPGLTVPILVGMDTGENWLEAH